MDSGNTYATPQGDRVMLYATDAFTVPERLVLERDGQAVYFTLLDPQILRCGEVAGVTGSCENADCHRTPLRSCACGRHEYIAGSGFVRKAVA